VAMIIGNSPTLPHSLIGPGATLGSTIVNQFAEAEPGLGTSSVIALGAVLFVLTVVVNMGGQALRRAGRSNGQAAYPVGPPAGTLVASPEPPVPSSPEMGHPGSAQIVTPVSTRAQRSLPLRLFRGRLAQLLCLLAFVAAAAPLVAMVGYTIARALPALSWGLLVHPVVPVGVPGGGISTAIAGSARAVGIGLAIAAPIGILTALFLYERQGRIASALRFSADVLTGVPSIVIGIFAFEVVVRPMHRPTTLAAGIALGAHRWRVVRSIVLRGSLPGLVAGNLLALARGVGETAPLLFTLAAPSLALTWLIYTDATEPFPAAQQLAWATALVLLAAVFALSVLARAIAWSLTRRAR
jgi:phosphate transport system permease protein